MIEVLDVTFAPFVNSEKPHLFTRPAARLINIGAVLTTLHTPVANLTQRAKCQDERSIMDVSVDAIFFCYADTLASLESTVQANLEGAFDVT